MCPTMTALLLTNNNRGMNLWKIVGHLITPELTQFLRAEGQNLTFGLPV